MAKKNSLDSKLPLTYRELQKENARLYEEAEAENPFGKIKTLPSPDPTEFIYDGPARSPLLEQGNGDYWGNSMFDEHTMTPAESLDAGELLDVRAKNQPLIAKWGSALGNGIALAGTTFVDGTLGFVYGGLKAIDTGDSSQIFQNEISNGLQDLNRYAEKAMPFYKTREDQNTPWYQQLGSVDFWADGFLKNLGFMVGALYSGGAWTKGLKGLHLLKDSKTLGAQLTGSLVSAVNEGRIEANHAAYDMFTNSKKVLDDSLEDYRQKLLADDSLYDNQKQALFEDIQNNYQTELQRQGEQAKQIGLMDLALNIPILTLNNFWTFGKFYSRGFSHASSSTKKGFFGRIKDKIAESNKSFRNAENPLRRVEKDANGNYIWDTFTNKEAVGKGLLTGLREGNEELAQAQAAEFATNYYSDSPDTYYKAVTDPTTERESLDLMASFSKSFIDTYGNGDRWEEFAIGALTGLLGVPTFGSVQNANADTYLGRGKKIGLTGGIFGERSFARELNKRGTGHVKAMNALKKDIESGKKNLMMRKSFINAMDGWAEKDDKFEFENAKDNEIFRQINAFLSTGREQDLWDIMGVDFENMSDE